MGITLNLVKTMKKILIPTDFSQNAENALKYAVELYKYERCEFFIIHAYADEVYDKKAHMARAVFNEVKANVYQNSEKELVQIERMLKEISPNPKHKYQTFSVFGTLIDEANDLVDQENIDIIIMGTHGKLGDKNLTFVSNTMQVIKYVKCPVLAIPSEYSYRPPKSVLFPTDYLLPYKRRELKLLNTLAKSFRSEIKFLFVSHYDKLSIRQEDNKAFLKECLSSLKMKFHTIASNDLTNTINEFLQINNIDFLVMVNSRHSYMENLLYQSSIDKIGLHIKTPFLVMQNLSRI